jgi:hypothetical protein
VNRAVSPESQLPMRSRKLDTRWAGVVISLWSYGLLLGAVLASIYSLSH